MREVYVAGIAMTPFGKFLDKSVKDLTCEVVGGVLADAGAAPGDLDAAFFANTTQSVIEGQYLVPGEIALKAAGINGLPVFNVENACASGSSAFHLAYAHVKAGLSEIALAVGAEKMYDADRAKSFAVFRGAWDVHDGGATMALLGNLGAGVVEPPSDGDNRQRSEFMDIYAELAKYHMKRFGMTQRQLAEVAAKNHQHSSLNALSQYRTSMTVDEVLGARRVSWPLTLPMCSPISDGAAAAIVCSKEALQRLAKARPVKVLASVLATGGARAPEELERHVCRRAAARAYEMAGVGPEDMSVAEVHDATAFAEILQSENLGFAAMGEGGALAESGATRLGGRIPINTSGGLESKGHPLGATGLGQIYELAQQVRGEAGPRQVEGARFAIAENGGGFIGCEEAVACITILGR